MLAEMMVILHDIYKKQPSCNSESLEKHLHAAVDWLLLAQTVNKDGGISASYKPLLGKWAPSYPETTGYTISTLLDYARRYQRRDVRNTALNMADYELSVQFPEGGFPCLQNKPGDQTWPVAFDTGQVLFGLLAAYQETNDARYFDAASRAADWLVSQLSPEGVWVDYHSRGSLQAIDTRVSWPLLIVSNLTGDDRYRGSAIKQLDWALKQQQENGWFHHCSFSAKEPPITHTIAYTIEGLLESGLQLGNERYILAAKKTADVLLNRLSTAGYLPGAFDRTWRPVVRWNCLTGSAQMARVWLRLGEITGLPDYCQAAGRAIRFIASTQHLDGMPAGIRGGIAGSWPIYGRYMRLKYPNWAANFFADAILKLLSQNEAPLHKINGVAD